MTRRPRIYLDHAATTPIRPEARAAMLEGLERWANPSSPHAEGRAARAALEDARERIKRALGWTGELILTSGASEALQIAFRQTRCGSRLLSPVEHDAVLRAAGDAAALTLDQNGEIARDALDLAVRRSDRPLVAVQHVNSETGQVQPVDEVARIVRARGGVLLCDASQSAGKTDLPDADLIVVSAHKLGGPPGIGALMVRDPAMLEASGGQERGYRGGTENLPASLGFAAAIEGWQDRGPPAGWPDAMDSFANTILSAGGSFVGGGRGEDWSSKFSWHIEAVAMPALAATTQLVRFDIAGFAVSAGSACSSGSMKASRVLAAFGVPDQVAARTIRISFGWTTTAADIRAFQDAWLEIAEDARMRAA